MFTPHMDAFAAGRMLCGGSWLCSTGATSDPELGALTLMSIMCDGATGCQQSVLQTVVAKSVPAFGEWKL